MEVGGWQLLREVLGEQIIKNSVLTTQLNFVNFESHWGKISAGVGPDLEGEQIVSMKMLRS